jgi:hypothetical protein
VKKLLAVTLIIAGFMACQKGRKPETGTATTGQITQELLDLDKVIVKSPPPLVAITSPIDIEFRQPMVPEHLKNTILDENPFEFDPDITGHAQWLSTQLLRFQPENYLPAGKTVQGVLRGEIAFGRQRPVNDFSFSFKVAEQEVLGEIGRAHV